MTSHPHTECIACVKLYVYIILCTGIYVFLIFAACRRFKGIVTVDCLCCASLIIESMHHLFAVQKNNLLLMYKYYSFRCQLLNSYSLKKLVRMGRGLPPSAAATPRTVDFSQAFVIGLFERVVPFSILI